MAERKAWKVDLIHWTAGAPGYEGSFVVEAATEAEAIEAAKGLAPFPVMQLRCVGAKVQPSTTR